LPTQDVRPGEVLLNQEAGTLQDVTSLHVFNQLFICGATNLAQEPPIGEVAEPGLQVLRREEQRVGILRDEPSPRS
jgi:hypothetical protein